MQMYGFKKNRTFVFREEEKLNVLPVQEWNIAVYLTAALVFLSFLLSYCNTAAAAETDAVTMRLLYCFFSLLFGAGFLLYGFWGRKITEKRLWRLLLFCGICAGIVCLLLSAGVGMYAAGAGWLNLLLGIIGGDLYYICAMALKNSQRRGRIVGGAMACAYLFNYLLRGVAQELWPMVLMGMLGAVLLFGRNAVLHAVPEENGREKERAGRDILRYTVWSVAGMLLLAGLLDGQITGIAWSSGGYRGWSIPGRVCLPRLAVCWSAFFWTGCRKGVTVL